jgi:hypothetical protein
MRTPAGTSRLYWWNYYCKRYEKFGREDSLHLATWYYLLALEAGEILLLEEREGNNS